MAKVLKMDPRKAAFFEKMEQQELGLTFDDVRLRTRASSANPPPSEFNIASRFSRNVTLRTPFVSAAMDTVTNSTMAIEMAKLGGLGVIPAAMDPDEQRREVRRVKLYMNGQIDHPVVVRDNETVENVLLMCKEKGYRFRTFPVVNEEDIFVGLLAKQNFKFCESSSVKVSALMTPADQVMSRVGTTNVATAYKVMTKNRISMLPILDKDGRVKQMFLYSDVSRIVEDRASYNTDKDGRLMVAAAVPTDEEAIERLRLIRKYIDVVVLDSANGDSYYAFETLKRVKKVFPGLDVVVGNVSEGESARELVLAGADGIKVGQGPGSICTTRIETGIGMPQVTAVYDCAKVIAELVKKSGGKYDVPVIADGGISNHGDISIAIAAGADAVMMGSMLAGTQETPGKVLTRKDGSRVKMYRGMGSPSAMKESKISRKRYDAESTGKVLAEGVESYVPYKGPVADVVWLCSSALKKSMNYVKVASIDEHKKITRFKRITNAGLAESRPHDVEVAYSNLT